MEQNNGNRWLAASRIALDNTACLQCLLKASQGLAENVSLMYCYSKKQKKDVIQKILQETIFLFKDPTNE